MDLSEWQAVDCDVCHSPLANGGFSTDVSYWNPETGGYEEVQDTSELCRNCHRQSESIDNSIDMGTGMHAKLGCTACHEPHRGTASCTNSTCHASLEAEVTVIGRLYMPPGHENAEPHDCGGAQCHSAATQVAQDNSFLHIGNYHGNLTCSACHDATGMEVEPGDDFLEWNTWQPVTWDGQEGKRPKFSHNVQREVDCTRCHYEANPWRLPVPSIFSQ